MRMHPSSLIPVALCTAMAACASTPRATAPAAVRSRTESGAGRTDRSATFQYFQLSDSIVHLATGDSIEWQSAGPAVVTGQPAGLLVTYYPFFDLSDTTRVVRTALAFFTRLRSKFEAEEPPFVVLRAVSLRAARRKGMYGMHAFGVVVQKRVDGRWYQLDDSIPLPP
jgi:hypothetical protein